MNVWDDLSNLVKTSAPILGSAIASANPLAGIGISLISQVFGANKSDAKDIFDKIQSDSESVIKLRKIEYDHQEELQKIASTVIQTDADDRKDARNMSVQLHSYVPTVIAIGYCLTYLIIQFYCILHPQTNTDVISARLHDGLMMILAYFFGRNHDNMFNNKNN